VIGKNMSEYKKIITMPVYNRADYTKEVLEGFKMCNGIENYTIYIFAEPGCQEVIDVIKSMTTLNIELKINETKLGLPKNTKQCLEHGFSLTNYNIHFEDDCVPGKDCLEYFELAKDNYEKVPEIFSITATSRDEVIPNTDNAYYQVERMQWFIPTAWATWADRWQEIKGKWTEVANLSWSMSAHNALNGRYLIYPRVSRIKYIGFEKSTNKNEEYQLEHHSTLFWINEVENIEKNLFHEK